MLCPMSWDWLGRYLLPIVSFEAKSDPDEIIDFLFYVQSSELQGTQ
jgi:hypothetical protein